MLDAELLLNAYSFCASLSLEANRREMATWGAQLSVAWAQHRLTAAVLDSDGQ